MKNNYIPDILKVKIISMFRFSYGLCLLLISILSAISLITFNINDNSFLTSTSNASSNLLGDLGSYFASFLFYTFGILAYLSIIFFFLYSVLIFIKKDPGYIFIRLLFFLISLVLIPQILIEMKIELSFIESIETWGIFANFLYELYTYNYVSYILTSIGIFVYIYSQNIFSFFKIPKLKLKNILKNNNHYSLSKNKIKKEPIINNISSEALTKEIDDGEINEMPSTQQREYFSPSLEILETDDALDRKKNR